MVGPTISICREVGSGDAFGRGGRITLESLHNLHFINMQCKDVELASPFCMANLFTNLGSSLAHNESRKPGPGHSHLSIS